MLLAGACSMALAAQVAGTVINLSGALMAKKADGTVKVLALRSEVEQGDTLVSERNTYAQIKFIDNSEMTLRPNTTFKIEAFAYDGAKPEADSASFSLVKGGLRSITGLLGKRNKEKFALKTPTATIGIRGTTFVVQYVEPDEEAVASLQAYLMASTAGLGQAGVGTPLPPVQANPLARPPGSSGGLRPGLHVFVSDGAIILSNAGGSLNFNAGQFGFVPSFRVPPVLVPNNPGLKFTPPPVFSKSSVIGTSSTSGGQTPETVDCEVR